MKKHQLILTSSATLAVVMMSSFDVQVGIFVRELTPDSLDDTLKFFSHWGLYLLYAIFAGLIIYSLLKKNRALTAVCLAYLKAQIIFSFAVVRAMKILLGRARPLYGTEFTFFSVDSHYNSFPSGHAADAFVSAVFLFYLLRKSKYRFLPLAYALFISLSRITASAHHPSDVVAGVVIGILGSRFMLREVRGTSINK